MKFVQRNVDAIRAADGKYRIRFIGSGGRVLQESLESPATYRMLRADEGAGVERRGSLDAAGQRAASLSPSGAAACST